MKSDANKGISKIRYNSLNLPENITKGSKTIAYTYSATGEKLENRLPDNKKLQYCGNFVYENGSLKYILNEEGKLNVGSGNQQYQFFVKDHLGNTRLAVAENGSIDELNHYYPFGMRMGMSSSKKDPDQKYLYNGKEMQEETDWLDYGARFYDPSLARFTTVDPLSEEFSQQSLYVYADNNPIRFIDFMGMNASTLVTENEDGTYKVVGGDANDGDTGVYLDDGNGGKGEKVGETATTHSFFDSQDKPVVGAKIDPKNTEGQDFIDNEIIQDDGVGAGVAKYAYQARNGRDKDFKVRGEDKRAEGVTKLQHRYRGGVTSDGKFASARDFGNMAAGIVTGRGNAPWGLVKKAFEALQGGPEPPVTLKAEKLGYKIGQKLYIQDMLNGKGD